MNIAIIGYGKMGKEIENIALQRNHVIKLIIDKNDLVSDYKKQLAECDVAIEFTQPDAVINNYKTCFNVGIPVVSGTTGWLKQWDEIIEYCNDVITWLRPARTQFNITYNNKTQKYVPDFVVETKNKMYLVEIKAKNEMDDRIVQQKADSAIAYCKTATKLNRQKNPKEKDWAYLLIPHNKVELNISFNKLVNDYKR